MAMVDGVAVPVLISAHRGGAKSSRSVENSLTAFTLAARAGVDFVEFDVRATKDGVFVVNHGATMWVGGRRRRISSLTWEQIRGAGVDVPTVEDVCREVVSPVVAHVDVKIGPDRDLVWRFASQVRELLGDGRFVFTSRNVHVTRLLAQWCDHVGVANCVGLSMMAPLARVPGVPWFHISRMWPAARFLASGAGFVVAHHTIARLGLLAWAETNNVRVLVWTVDSERVLKHLLSDQRVWAITSNDPVRALGFRTVLTTQ